MSADETCRVTLYRGADVWHSRREECGKPAKGHLPNGDPACGVHLRASKARASRAEREQAWNDRLAAMSEALGVRVFGFDVDGPVSMRAADMDRIIARLAEGDTR